MRSWMLYYGDELPPETFYPYDLIVFDGMSHPLLSPLNDRRKLLLGYLSLGEVEKHRPWYEAVKAEGLLVGENGNWPGSFFVDVRDPRWTRRVIDDLVPRILSQGFDGIFIDTLDNPPELERRDPSRFAGMTQAAVHLVRAIRHHFPEIKIMLNRGYAILPQVEEAIDMVLGESVYARYDAATKSYRLVPRDAYLRQVKILQEAHERAPRLQIFTLDYWDPKDEKGIREIYRVERANGFLPLVGTIDLNRVIPPPGAAE